MTLPDERYRAVKMARSFLYDLCDSKKTPGVPRRVREQARGVLRHYPDDYHMNVTAQAVPHVFQERMEEVSRMMAVYEQRKAERSTDES
jgi:hypothetical protein